MYTITDLRIHSVWKVLHGNKAGNIYQDGKHIIWGQEVIAPFKGGSQ